MGTIPTPKGFIYNPIYEPDKEAMLKALRIVLEMPTPRKESGADPLQGNEHRTGDKRDAS